MFGQQIRLIPFDASKKGSWLEADLSGLIHTWSIFVFVLLVLVGITDGLWHIGFFERFTATMQFFEQYLGRRGAHLSVFAASFVPPFFVVFILRRNFVVIGNQRQFRYLCRWL